MKEEYPSLQFSIFRLVLGTYLLLHFIYLLPDGADIWSSEGTLPQASLNFTYGLFPNLLYHFDSPSFINYFLYGMIALSLAFMIGFFRPLSSFLLWYGWACLFHRNNLIISPGQPFIAWMLLCFAFIPSGEALSLFPKSNTKWKMPFIVVRGAWIILAVGYAVSGIDKLRSPSWFDGSALGYMLDNPLSRIGILRDFLQNLPPLVLNYFTWMVVLLELLFLPMVAFKKTRFMAWIAMTMFHMTLLCLMNFTDLTMAMLMIHFFVFDVSWLTSQKSKIQNNQAT